MKLSDNFERARALSENWPEWKRSYELTKNSVHSSTHTPLPAVARGGRDGRDAERKAFSPDATKDWVA
jgi:hypothetical protein